MLIETKISNRKRTNKSAILASTKEKGFTTEDEKTQLTTIEVKNALQRMNNVAMGRGFKKTENQKLQILMEKFLIDVKGILG